MSEQPPRDRKPALHLVPAILTGAAALIASLTAVYVNVRGDRAAKDAPAHVAPATPATPKVAAKVAPAPVDRWIVRVDRIAVQHDGSPGTTDWRFTVEADDDALFAFQQEALDDTGGRNVAVPEDASGVLRLDGKPGARLVVKGWRGRLFGLGSAPDAIGEGTLTARGAIAPIRVVATPPEGGAFVFHVSADER